MIVTYFCCSFAKADAKKQEGNREYVQKHYEEAVKLYTEAIGMFIISYVWFLY